MMCAKMLLDRPKFAVYRPSSSSTSTNVVSAVTYLQSSYNHPTILSAQAHRRSACPQHPFFSSGHSHSSTHIIILTNHWPFLSVCLTSSLESASGFSPTTPDQPLSFWLISSYTRHLILHCWLTTVIIRHFFAVSLQAQNLPVPQIISTLDFLPSSGLSDWLHGFLPGTVSSEHIRLLFSFFHFTGFSFWSCAVD